MKFKYKAKGVGGTIFEGEEDAADKFSLARSLRSRGSTLISASPLFTAKYSWEAINESVVPIRLKDKAVFASNLSAMISAGLSLSRALEVLQKQTKNSRFKRIIYDINSAIAEGTSFSKALSEYPKVFPPVFVAMVHAGEESGNLAESMKCLADQMEKTYAIRQKVRGALMYPLVVIVAMLGIGVVMLIYVVPTLSQTFKQFGGDLPTSTKFVIWLGDFAASNTGMLVLGITIFTILAWRFAKTSLGRRASNYVAINVPVVGSLVVKVNAAVVARTIASLTTSGVNMVEAIDIGKEVVQNVYYKEALEDAKNKIEKGELLSHIFKDYHKLFPPFVEEMTEVGEETGKLPEMLTNTAIFYENEVESATKNLSTIIEPILMLMIGAAVGFFALSIIQPIYSLGQKM